MSERYEGGQNDITCSAVASLAFEYIDGEMHSEQRARMEDHVHRCPPCRNHLERERGFLKSLRSKLAGERCPDVVRDRIREAMRQRREAQSGG